MSEGKPNTVEKDPCEAALANEEKDSSEAKALGKEDTSLESPIELETLLFGKKTKDPDMSLDSLDPDYDVSEAVSSEEQASDGSVDASDSDGSEDHGTVKMPERKQNTVEKDPCEEKHNSVVESKAVLAKEEKDSEANAALVKALESTIEPETPLCGKNRKDPHMSLDSLDPIAEAVSSDNGSVDANDDTSASDGSEDDAIAHEFWEMQPVWKFRDLFEKNLREGPIEVATLLSEVKQEPHELPRGYEWNTLDMTSTGMFGELCRFLRDNYTDYEEGAAFKYRYSEDFLKWAFLPPGYYNRWHLGVREKGTRDLVAFVSGVPARIRVGDEVYKMAKISFLCIEKELRSQRLAPVMIMELKRRVNLENTWQGTYCTDEVLPTPLPITTCKYWGRMLNRDKLMKDGVTTIVDVIKKYYPLFEAPEQNDVPAGLNLQDAPVTRGFRKMERRDVPAVTLLLRTYLSQFKIAPDFDENDVEHLILPREDVVESYVVELPETQTISDFCSFYHVPLSIRKQPFQRLKCAYSFYNVATVTPFVQLMNDALIMCKLKGFDLFYALDVMRNEEFFRELKFGEGYGELNYYLYNYRLTRAFKPSEVGFVLT